MNTILFSTSSGAPIATLLMSSPVSAKRDCIFATAAQDTETFDSPEGEAILPDRPTEYPCRYESTPAGTRVAFENQNGWRFTVVLGADDHGTWSAQKDQARLSGKAFALRR